MWKNYDRENKPEDIVIEEEKEMGGTILDQD